MKKTTVLKFFLKRFARQLQRPELTNIYHASVQKSGSQWLKALFTDKRIENITKLTAYPQHRYEWNEFKLRFPTKSFVPGLYISYQSYEEIIKPEKYSTMYILRDPRDLVVSWYYSMKYSHGLMGKVAKHRKNLEDLDENEGLSYCIRHFQLKLSFMKDWVLNCTDPNVFFLKFEDLINKPIDILFDFFNRNGYDIEKDELKMVIQDYSKEKMREKENTQGKKHFHYREKPSNWQESFNEEHIELFKKINGNVVEILGYSW